MWESVTFKAKRYIIEVRTDKNYHVSALKITISGKHIKIPQADYQKIIHPQLQKITITDVSGSRGASSYLEIPVLAEPKIPNGTFQDGGSWFFYFTDGKYTGMEAPDVQ